MEYDKEPRTPYQQSVQHGPPVIPPDPDGGADQHRLPGQHQGPAGRGAAQDR